MIGLGFAEFLERLNADGITAVRGTNRIDLGRLYGMSQWDVFQADMQAVAEAVTPELAALDDETDDPFVREAVAEEQRKEITDTLDYPPEGSHGADG